MKRLELANILIRRAQRTLLSDVSLSVEAGEFVALVGPNGAGKTTLFKTALALFRPDHGEVLLDGEPIFGLSPRQRAARISWLPQNATLNEPLSALDVVTVSRYRFVETHASARRAALAALERVGVGVHAERSVLELSGGERQRVLLAALLAQEAPTLLVDEPANHLDPAQQIEVYGLLGKLWAEGHSLLSITHDVNLLAHVTGHEKIRVIGVSQGRLAFEARYTDADLPEKLGSLFGVRMRALGQGRERVIVPELESAAFFGCAMKTRIVLLVFSCLLILTASAFVGPSLDGSRGAFIFWQLRVPRALVGAMVGATLGLAGAVFQLLFNNPLATPSTVGTTAGATLGALAALAFNISPELEGLPIVTTAAFAGALAASFIVASIASAGRARMSDVLLAGIAVTLAASALATGIQYASDARAIFSAVQWSLGQLPQVGYQGVILLAPFTALSCAALLGLGRALATLAVGEELAHAQGVDVPKLRFFALTLGSLGVAACVAWCGPIAFVGLIVPHLVRLLTGPSPRTVLPLSLLGGAGFLVLCDALSRALLPGRELPVGVVTAALGAPALVVLIARARSQA